MRFLLRATGFTVALLLTGCNDESGPGIASPSSAMATGVVTSPIPLVTLKGSVMVGPVRNARVTVSRWQTGGYVSIASTLTDHAGNYNLALSNVPAGYLRLDMGLSNDPARPTEMQCVAVTCGSASFGQWFPLTASPRMSSWAVVNSNGTAATMPITPYSTMTVRYAEQLGGGMLASQGVAFAKRRITALLAPSGGSPGLTPGNVADTAFVQKATPASLKWSLMVAAFAELARSQGVDLATLIDRYSGAFGLGQGQLLQAAPDGGSQPSIAALIQAALTVDGLARGTAATDLQTWLAQLQPGLVNPLPPMVFDSEAFLQALGPMGLDVRAVMQNEGAATLEALMVNQLSKFRWLAVPESKAVAVIGVKTVLYSMMCSAMLANMPANSGSITLGDQPLMVVLNTETRELTMVGVEQGMDVNLRISLTALNAGSTASPFLFTAIGSVSNANMSASINGTLKIDPTSTNLGPLLAATQGLFTGNANALPEILSAIGGILQTGHGIFTLTGSAGIQSLTQAGSELSINGKATMDVNMGGGSSGAIKASGAVSYGTLTLPNGARFSVTPSAGEYLRFVLGDSDGTFAANFSSYALGLPQTVVKGSGRLAGLGALLTGVRNTLTSHLTLGQLDLTQVIASLSNLDLGQLALTIKGQASILGNFNHVYTLNLSNGSLLITQPNSTAAAIRATGGWTGGLVKVGNLSYVAGLDLQNLQNPALTVSDVVSGNVWRMDWASLNP